MKYFQILLENKEENIRYLSPMVYKETEINSNTRYIIIRDAVVLRSESAGMMDEWLIEEIVENTKIVGKVEMKVNTMVEKGLV